MAFGTFTTPVSWQEGDYTVTRTNSWSPPGDHPTGAGMLLYVKDGVLEKVEGDPQQSMERALAIRMLSLPEYVYSPYRILHPLRRDPARRGDDAAWEQCTWDEACDLVAVENVRRCTEQYGSNSIATFVGTGREAGNWGPTMSCHVFGRPTSCTCSPAGRATARAWPAPPTCWARRIPSSTTPRSIPPATTTRAGSAPRSS